MSNDKKNIESEFLPADLDLVNFFLFQLSNSDFSSRISLLSFNSSTLTRERAHIS